MVSSVLILFLIALYSAYVLRKLYRDKKSGKCTGCSAKSCSSCQLSDPEYVKRLIKEARER